MQERIVTGLQDRRHSLLSYVYAHPRRVLALILAVQTILALRFATVGLDVDEFEFVREPYELIGGDYARGYLQRGELGKALDVARRSYCFFWKYRPLNAPMVSTEDQTIFATEEKVFGYTPPSRIARNDPEAVSKYRARLIVPEPDRMYRYGAGKPLLSSILMVPQLGAVAATLKSPKKLLDIQFTHNYHPIFILVRFVQLLAGLLAVILTYWIIEGIWDSDKALLGAALMALNPIAIMYFPNIHQDAVMVPFLIWSMGLILRRRLLLGGIAFGLALACKNAAILVAPAMVYLLLSRSVWAGNGEERWTRVFARSRRVLFFAIMAFLTLLPFASPVSYAKELLSPISRRVYDPRGEDIASYSLVGKGNHDDPASLVRSTVRPEIGLLERVGGLKFTLWLPAILGLLVIAKHMQGACSSAAWIWMLAIFPAGAVFSYSMNYRALMFLPSFAVLGATLLPRRWVWILILALGCVSVIYALDPMTVHPYHTPVQ